MDRSHDRDGFAVPRRLFVVIFEGRSGSSELMARLGRHCEIQTFPEILSQACSADSSEAGRRAFIIGILDSLMHGRAVESYTAEYTKVGPQFDALPIRGFKTRLNTICDREWFARVQREENFYQVDRNLLLPLLEERGFRLVRLARRNIVRQAVSWLRAAHLANMRGNVWSIPRGGEGLGPIWIDPDALIGTIAWLGASRTEHDQAFQAYRGDKILVHYEDVLSADPAPMERLLAFLGAGPQHLSAFFDRLTELDLSRAILNYDQVAKRIEYWGLGHCLADASDRRDPIAVVMP
jgi:hypothetical protein